MTSESCLTGTDRICEVANKFPADVYINVQGDEPVLNPKDLIKLIKFVKKDPSKIYNGYAEIEDKKNYYSPNIQSYFPSENKIVNVYFSSAIPSDKTFNFVKA